MKILVASPYREGSIVSIATAASRAGSLDSFCTTLYTPGLLDRLKTTPIIGERLAVELGRRAFKDIPADKVKSFASFPEICRIAAYRASTGLFDFPAPLMYWVKDRFDEAVARELRRKPVDCVVGMWGSSSMTFAAAGDRCLKVLNFVNSRPRFHNLFLKEYAGLQPDNGEMLSLHVAANVEREIALADLILVPSSFVAKQFSDHTAKVVIAPYGVNLKDFSPGPPDDRFRCNVLALGQISYRKGFTTLVQAASRLSQRSFRAVGPKVAPELLKNLPANLEYKGLVVHDEVPSVMRSADVLVLASFEDAYPLVIMEAMASGTPVIVSDHAGTSELVTHGVDGFIFQAGKIDELCSYIEQIVGNPDLRKKMAEAARSKVAASHSWTDYSSRILEIIGSTKS